MLTKRVGRVLLVKGLMVVGCSRSNAAAPDASPAAAGSFELAQLAPSPPAPATSGAKPFGTPCVADTECEGSVCFHKRLKSPDAGRESRASNDPVEHDGYCSVRCNNDAECPVPLTKGRCGARGMCKRPD